MIRSLLRVAGALSFLGLVTMAGPAAAPAPGLGYDEIVRIVVNASPPPPGNFQNDLAQLTAATPVPTAAPKKRGIGFGAIAGAVLGGGGAGDIGGAIAGDVAANAVDNALEARLGAEFGTLAASLRGFLDPHLLRYAYLNGWERVDDVTAQTATIRKCDLGQVVQLDLAKKTYRTFDPHSEPSPAAAPAARSRGRASDAPSTPGAPGTAVLTVTSTMRALGPMHIENHPTSGYAATASVAITQATGSCRNGSAAVTTTEYLSALAQPNVTMCPLHRAPIPQTADDVVAPPAASGGCRPTVAFHQSGSPPPAGKLALYSLVSMNAATATPAPGSDGSAGVGFLTERGNLKPLMASDAALFDIPAGFTRMP